MELFLVLSEFYLFQNKRYNQYEQPANKNVDQNYNFSNNINNQVFFQNTLLQSSNAPIHYLNAYRQVQ